jgi:hypothetical protein
MMQTTNPWERNHLPHLRWLDGPRHRAVIAQLLMRSAQLLMRSAGMIVVDVAAQDATQVLLIEHDDMIEDLATNRANQSLAIRVLPW